jgi:hypothetical protein
MCWLKRCFWLSAWSVWIWPGFGLYRELPRGLGPLICQIPLEEDCDVVGFVGETNLVAFQKLLPPQTYEIKLFDAEKGSAIVLKDAWGRPDLVNDFRGCVQRGFLIVNDEWEPDSKQVVAGIQCIDLTTGERRRLTRISALAATLHPHRPWLAVSELTTDWKSEIHRVVVIDLYSGRELFSRESPPGRRIERRSFFIPGTDKLVIPTPALAGTESRTDGGVEIWQIGPPAVMEKLVRGASINKHYSISSTGKIAQQAADHSTVCVVFDLNEERVVFSASPLETGRGATGVPRIALSGRTVFASDPGILWDVASGKVLRRDAEGESTFPSVLPEQLLTIELWSVWWKRWFPNLRYTSTAFRDIESGRLLVRLKGVPGIMSRNRTGTLVATTTGSVHRLPYVVDWPLLALCLAVLALPLVMLWVVLRLLSRRKLRRGTAVPRNSTM